MLLPETQSKHRRPLGWAVLLCCFHTNRGFFPSIPSPPILWGVASPSTRLELYAASSFEHQPWDVKHQEEEGDDETTDESSSFIQSDSLTMETPTSPLEEEDKHEQDGYGDKQEEVLTSSQLESLEVAEGLLDGPDLVSKEGGPDEGSIFEDNSVVGLDAQSIYTTDEDDVVEVEDDSASAGAKGKEDETMNETESSSSSIGDEEGKKSNSLPDTDPGDTDTEVHDGDDDDDDDDDHNDAVETDLNQEIDGETVDPPQESSDPSTRDLFEDSLDIETKQGNHLNLDSDDDEVTDYGNWTDDRQGATEDKVETKETIDIGAGERNESEVQIGVTMTDIVDATEDSTSSLTELSAEESVDELDNDVDDDDDETTTTNTTTTASLEVLDDGEVGTLSEVSDATNSADIAGELTATETLEDDLAANVFGETSNTEDIAISATAPPSPEIDSVEETSNMNDVANGSSIASTNAEDGSVDEPLNTGDTADETSNMGDVADDPTTNTGVENHYVKETSGFANVAEDSTVASPGYEDDSIEEASSKIDMVDDSATAASPEVDSDTDNKDINRDSSDGVHATNVSLDEQYELDAALMNNENGAMIAMDEALAVVLTSPENETNDTATESNHKGNIDARDNHMTTQDVEVEHGTADAQDSVVKGSSQKSTWRLVIVLGIIVLWISILCLTWLLFLEVVGMTNAVSWSLWC